MQPRPSPNPYQRQRWRLRLRRRLQAIASSLKDHTGTLALLGLGSAGADTDRMDEYSDLDFFVVVEHRVQAYFLENIEWLRNVSPVIYDFENSERGRKILFHDGVFAEYAVFTEEELKAISEPSMRVIWSKDKKHMWDGVRTRPVPFIQHYETPEYHLNEAMTNLLVGLMREKRGELLTAMRFIQVYAVNHVLALYAHEKGIKNQCDPYAIERRAEQWAADVPFESFCPGYCHNSMAAGAVLEWLVHHGSPCEAMVEIIRSLLDGRYPGEYLDL